MAKPSITQPVNTSSFDVNTEQFKQWLIDQNQSKVDNRIAKPLIMGILNLTPDSFSDGGRYNQLHQALARSHQMIADGVDLIDVGGESTKPGASSVSCKEELARVIPLIKQLRKETDLCISIDTVKAQVMHEAINAGASVINNVEGFRSKESLVAARDLDVPLCLVHMQGEPQTMQINPNYKKDVIDEINQFFEQTIENCLSVGIKEQNLILDPGFGFGKKVEHNLRLIKEFAKFKEHKRPLMLGVSRKSTLGIILNAPVHNRLAGGLAIALYAALQGLSIIRTHDVAETRQTFDILEAIR